MEHDSYHRRKYVKGRVEAIKKAMEKHEKKESAYNEHKEGEYKNLKVKK